MYNSFYQFIFTEIDKNATTLLTEALKHVSPLWQPNDNLRLKYKLFNGTGEMDEDSLKLLCKESWHYKHASLAFWRQQLGEEKYLQCTRFALVRNSWDRVVSLYLRDQGSTRHDLKKSFVEFVRWIRNASDTCGSFGDIVCDSAELKRFNLSTSGCGPEPDGIDSHEPHRGYRRHQLSYLSTEGNVDIDHWIDIGEKEWFLKVYPILRQCGIDDPALQAIKNFFDSSLGILRCHLHKAHEECPGGAYDPGGVNDCRQLNRSPNRNQKIHYSAYYTDETRDIIGEKFKLDNDYFGFTFDDKRADFSSERLEQIQNEIKP